LFGFLPSFLFIAIAEMGDKTQLIALSLATRYKPLKVILGIFLGTLVSFSLSAFLGDRIGLLIPLQYLRIIVGVSFIVFGFWTIKGENGRMDKEKNNGRFDPVLTVAVAFFLAEIGDKTQLATVSLAAKYHSFFGVWLGSVSGMVVADGLAIIVGIFAGKKLPEKVIRYISAAAFIIFGLITMIGTTR
jgi:Ca2+/H+ antiporter, TMEM165/GDT1 family